MVASEYDTPHSHMELDETGGIVIPICQSVTISSHHIQFQGFVGGRSIIPRCSTICRRVKYLEGQDKQSHTGIEESWNQGQSRSCQRTVASTLVASRDGNVYFRYIKKLVARKATKRLRDRSIEKLNIEPRTSASIDTTGRTIGFTGEEWDREEMREKDATRTPERKEDGLHHGLTRNVYPAAVRYALCYGSWPGWAMGKPAMMQESKLFRDKAFRNSPYLIPVKRRRAFIRVER